MQERNSYYCWIKVLSTVDWKLYVWCEWKMPVDIIWQILCLLLQEWWHCHHWEPPVFISFFTNAWNHFWYLLWLVDTFLGARKMDWGMTSSWTTDWIFSWLYPLEFMLVPWLVIFSADVVPSSQFFSENLLPLIVVGGDLDSLFVIIE